MSRIIERLYHWVIWLGRALGLVKRPLPESPDIPWPTEADTPLQYGPPTVFYGPFIPQWGSFEFRERVLFDFRYQVHGCGDHAQKYGIKDPIKNRIVFRLHIWDALNTEPETVFLSDGSVLPVEGACVDRLYWIPGYRGTITPPQMMGSKRRPLCGTMSPPLVPKPVAKTTLYQIGLTVIAPNGQEWSWEPDVEVSGNPCK